MTKPESPTFSIDLPPKNFLHPERGTLPPDGEIKLYGQHIRNIVDATRPDAQFPELNPKKDGVPRTLDEVAHVVRLRYPDTAKRVDEMFDTSMQKLQENPDNEKTKKDSERSIALAGAYNYVRGIQVLRYIDPNIETHHDEKGIPTDNVQRDTDIVPSFTLSPSALFQLQEHTDIKPEDNVLYLCAGGGGGVFMTAAAMPETLDAVDLYTPKYYDVNGTFALAKKEVYEKLPQELKPDITTPKFIEQDATDLPQFDSEEARKKGFQKNHYNKILLHPPYGRESMLSGELQQLTEADGFMLWVDTALSANNANTEEAELYSIVPPQWGKAIDVFNKGTPMQEVLTNMYDELKDLPYYKGQNATKLEQPHDETKAKSLNVRRSEVKGIFTNNYPRHDLQEMGMFPLQINILHLPGKAKTQTI